MKYIAIFWMLANMIIMDTCDALQIKESIVTEPSGLEYLVRESKNTDIKPPVLVLLHGYGSNEKDLFSLSDQIPDHWLVISVQAPHLIAKNKYKWYDVKMVDDKITANMEDEKKSRAAVIKLIDEVVVKYNGDESRVVMAGFSQGAIMSLNIMLTNPDNILAAGCFSGRMMKGIIPLVKEHNSLKAKRVFISHGTKDEMLPVRYAEESQAQLEDWGLYVTTVTDHVAHTISGKQLEMFVTWLAAL